MGIFQRLAQVFVRQTPEREERPTEIGPAKTAGYQSFYHYWGRYPRDLPTFSFLTIQMMLIEPTIRLGLAMRAAPMRSIEWGWKEGKTWNPGIQAQDPDVATYVERQLKRIWADLDAVLTAQIWGWAGGEVVLRLNPTTEQVEVDRLLPRHANDLRARAYEGQPCGVRVLRINSHTNGYIDLDWPKGFWHAFNPECGRHYGESVLLGCYSPWWDKWMDGGGLDVRRLFMHKDAYAGADLTYPEGNQYINNQEVPNRDIAREIVEQLVAGGVTTRPAQYDAGGNELWKLTRAAVASSPGHILQYPKDLDVEMLRGMGIPDDVLTSENTGAWEGKKVPMAAFYAGLDSWAGQLIRDMDATVIRPLVKLNWGCDQEYEIGHKPLGEQALESQANGGKADKQGDGGGFSDLFGGGDSGEDPGPQNPATPPGPQPGQRMSLAVGRGVVQATELVKAAHRVMRMRTEGSERWITIGGRKTEDGEHSGGVAVKIDADGTILAGGPKFLHGKNVKDSWKSFRRSASRKKSSGKAGERRTAKAAKGWGMSQEEYDQAAEHVWKQKAQDIAEREAAKKYAREQLHVDAGRIKQLEEQGRDYSSGDIKGLDTLGREMASLYPGLGWGGGYEGGEGDEDAKLWELLKEGKQTVPGKHSDEYHAAVDEYLQYLADSSGQGGDGDTSFDFGANEKDDPDHYEFALQKRLFPTEQSKSGDQGRLDFDEKEHPRGPDGEFVKKGSSAERKKAGAKSIRERLAGSDPVKPGKQTIDYGSRDSKQGKRIGGGMITGSGSGDPFFRGKREYTATFANVPGYEQLPKEQKALLNSFDDAQASDYLAARGAGLSHQVSAIYAIAGEDRAQLEIERESRQSPAESFTLENAPAPDPKPAPIESTGGDQQSLFSKSGLPGQQNLFADKGVPEDMVAKPADKLHFGIADNLPDDAFDADELARGTLHEMEHTDDPDVAKEIAKDHLAEDPDYYKKLEAIE